MACILMIFKSDLHYIPLQMAYYLGKRGSYRRKPRTYRRTMGRRSYTRKTGYKNYFKGADVTQFI